jgi:eukaryotic-like serine/threonine-protein kinase
LKRGYLTLVAGKEIGRRFVLRLGQRFTIGRGRSVNIPLDDNAVSRRHAEVELLAEGLLVTDLGSRNGTTLDDAPLREGRTESMRAGARLRLGAHVFQVSLVDVDEEEGDEEGTRRILMPTVPEDYEVLGELGRGGTGVVYAARHRVLRRRVAIKVPRPESPNYREETPRRFLREARLQCQVESPYVVGVHDIRQIGERTYLILELVNGSSAKDRLASGPLPLHEALRIGEYTALALDAVHRAKVVHRDVKPANILLTVEGAVKLSDFGIAKALDDDSSIEPITASGEGLGTIIYSAPEQLADARRADARADIYALGATLYHLISGVPHVPVGMPVEEVIRYCSTTRPSLTEACDAVPHSVAELVHHMLDPRPEGRPAIAADLATKLHDVWAAVFANSRLRSLSETHDMPVLLEPSPPTEG